jgi:hypothetical protein
VFKLSVSLGDKGKKRASVLRREGSISPFYFRPSATHEGEQHNTTPQRYVLLCKPQNNLQIFLPDVKTSMAFNAKEKSESPSDSGKIFLSQ